MNWKKKARNWLEIASELSDILIHLRDNPKPTDYASIGLRLVNSYMTHHDQLKNDSFEDWERVDLWEYRHYLYDNCETNFEHKVVREDEESVDYITTAYDVQIGWNIRNDFLRGPFYKRDAIDYDGFLHILGRIVWESIKSHSCVLTKKSSRESGESQTIMRADNSNDRIFESDVANKIHERIEKFIKEGYNRSIMLYGEPGTGKTALAKYITKKIGGYSLRLNVAGLEHLDSEDMLLAVQILAPDVLLIDDFDRVFRPSRLLSELEEFNNSIKLIIATVNDIDSLDRAVIRPGRFDDLIKIDKIDDGIVDKLIGEDIPKDIKNKLKKFPIAYVSDFHKRRKVLGTKQALVEIINLENRIQEINKSNEEEPETTKSSKKTKRKKSKKSTPNQRKQKKKAK